MLISVIQGKLDSHEYIFRTADIFDKLEPTVVYERDGNTTGYIHQHGPVRYNYIPNIEKGTFMGIVAGSVKVNIYDNGEPACEYTTLAAHLERQGWKICYTEWSDDLKSITFNLNRKD